MNMEGEMSKRRIIVVNVPDDISPELAARRLAEARAEAGRDGVVIRVVREDGQTAGGPGRRPSGGPPWLHHYGDGGGATGEGSTVFHVRTLGRSLGPAAVLFPRIGPRWVPVKGTLL